MLGDSLRRRHGPEDRPAREPEKRRPRGPRSAGRLSSLGKWLLAAVVVLGASFGVGYLLSTQLLFPRPETAGTGIGVPSLYGETQESAEAAILEAGLQVGEVTAMASMDTERGRILAQHPLPGQQLRRGASVSFSVSGGPPELRVPPLRGMDVASARELLESVGFDVAVRQVRDDGGQQGLVVGTEPAAGVARTLPAAVTLMVSAGPPAESPEPGVAPVGQAAPSGGADAPGGADEPGGGRP